MTTYPLPAQPDLLTSAALDARICPDCGDEMRFAVCGPCEGFGVVEGREYDALFYGFDTLVPCKDCGGRGGVLYCRACEVGRYGETDLDDD